MQYPLKLIKILIPSIIILQIFTNHAISQNNPLEQRDKEEILLAFMKDEMGEIDFYALEELIESEVEVASLFLENDLIVGSTVSAISAEQWKMLGAKRMQEALGNEMSVVTYDGADGAKLITIRGYTQLGADKGVSLLIDGVPCNEVLIGSSANLLPNWDLGTLNKIEMIKGPGSSIYGSDAFHGVISLKTFEEDTDHYSFEAAGAYPLYGDGSIKISQGFGGDLFRIDLAAGASCQEDQNLEYEYDDPTGFSHPTINVSANKGKATRKYKYNSQTGTLKLRAAPEKKLNVKIGVYIFRGEFEDFPGLVATNIEGVDDDELVQSQDNDIAGTASQFLMTNGAINYELPKKITLEASGYYWVGEKEYYAYIGPKSLDVKYIVYDKIYRTGAKFIVKQPDNAINLQWLIAYSFTKMKIDYSDAEAFWRSTVIVNRGPLLTSGFSRDIHSVFCQFKWGAVKDYLFVLAGARNDYYSDFGNQVTPRAGLIFLPAHKSSIKALYGRAFRAPSANERAGAESYAKGNDDLKAETIDSFELSYIYKETKWKGSINAFYSIWKNAIAVVDAPELTNYSLKYVNKGENDSLGGEINLFYSLKPFAFDFGLSFVKSRALDVDDPLNPGKKTDRYYSSFPEYFVKAGFHYTVASLKLNFYLNNIVYLGMKEAPEDVKTDPDSLPAYHRMDLNIAKVINDDFELYLNVRNLLNRENRLPSVFGADNGYVEPGISVMFRAGYKL